MKKIIPIMVAVFVLVIALSQAFIFDFINPFGELLQQLEEEGATTFGSEADDLLISDAFFPPLLDEYVIRDYTKYDTYSVFLASSDDWKGVMKATTLAVWNSRDATSCSRGFDSLATCAYPLFVVHENDFHSINRFVNDKGDADGFYFSYLQELVPGESKASFEVTPLTLEDYYAYWSTVNAVVAVHLVGDDQIDYDVSIHAATLAANLDLPLVFLEENDLSSLKKVIGTKNIEKVLLVSRNGGATYDPLVKKYFKRALLQEVSVGSIFSAQRVHKYFRFDSFMYHQDVLPIQQGIVYNPADIIGGSCTSSQEFSFEESLGDVQTVLCKDSLLAPYLANYYSQQLVPVKTTEAYMQGLSLDSAADNQELYVAAINNVRSTITIAKADEPVFYTTFLGSPNVLPFDGLDKFDADLLMADTTRARYGFVPRGRVMGLTTSDTSTLLMTSFFQEPDDSILLGGFNSPNMIGQKYIPLSPDAFGDNFDKIKFYNPSWLGQMYISEDNGVESKAEFVNYLPRATMILIEEHSSTDETSLLASLFAVEEFKNMPLIFLIGNDTTNMSQKEHNPLLLIRRGARGIYGFTNDKLPSAQMKYFPAVFYTDFYPHIKQGEVESLHRRLFLDVHWPYPSQNDAEPVSLSTKVDDLSFSSMSFIGDPLNYAFTPIHDIVKRDKSVPNQPPYALLDIYSDLSTTTHYQYLSDDFYERDFIYARWGLQALTDDDHFRIESMIFPGEPFVGDSTDTFVRFNSLQINPSGRYSIFPELRINFLSSGEELISIEPTCADVEKIFESFPRSYFYISPYLEDTVASVCEGRFVVPKKELEGTIWTDFLISSSIEILGLTNAFPLRAYNPDYYPLIYSTGESVYSNPFSVDVDGSLIDFPFVQNIAALEGRLIFCLDKQDLDFYPLFDRTSFDVDESFIKITHNLEAMPLDISVRASFIEEVNAQSHDPNLDDIIFSKPLPLELVPYTPASDRDDFVYLESDMLTDTNPICFMADLTEFDSINRDKKQLMNELQEEFFTKQYAFDIDVDFYGYGGSYKVFTPVHIANSFSKQTVWEEVEEQERFVIPKGVSPVQFLTMDNQKIPLDYSYIPNRLYRTEDKKGLVVYMGDGVFFDYYLKTAFQKDADGNIYEELSLSHYSQLLASYREEFSTNHHNPLNEALLEEIFRWLLARANNPCVGSDWNAKGSIVYFAGGDTVTAQEYFGGCVAEGYDCIGLPQGAYQYIFQGEKGCPSPSGGLSFYACNSGLQLFQALKPLGFSADIHYSQFPFLLQERPELFEDVPREDFSVTPLVNPPIDYSLFFPSYFDMDGNEKDRHIKRIMDEDYSNFYFHDDYGGCADLVNGYPRGSIMESHGMNGDESHAYFKGTFSDTVEAHVGTYSKGVTMGGSGDGVSCGSILLLIYPTGFDVLQEPISYDLTPEKYLSLFQP